MERDWKHQLKDKMESYSEPAPEGLWEDILSSVESSKPAAGGQGQDARRKTVRILSGITGIAAAILLLLMLFRPDGEQHGIVGQDSLVADNSGRSNGVEMADEGAGISMSPEVTEEGAGSSTDARNDGGTGPSTPVGTTEVLPDSGNVAIPTEPGDDVIPTGQSEQRNLPENNSSTAVGATEKETSPANDAKDDEEINIIKRNPTDWQDILLADAAEKKTPKKKVSFSVYGSGFFSKANSHSGYSDAVNEFASTNSMQYGQSALAGIMLFNRTKTVTTDSKHYLPVKAGVTFSWNFTPRWSLETGIMYSWLLSRQRTGSDSYYVDSRQTLHYLGVPLAVGYSIWSNNWLNIYASAGGMLEKCVGGNERHNYTYSNDTRDMDTEKLAVKPLQWSVMASAGAQFKITDFVGIYLEPGVIYHFDNGSEVRSSYTEQPFNFNLNLGLRFSFE